VQDTDCHKRDILRGVACPKVLIALGGNLKSKAGTPLQTLRLALERLGDSQFTVESVSQFYATPCFPAGAGPDYVNAAAVLTGSDDPDHVLGILHTVEAEFGRARDQRWGRRTLDLDLIALGDRVLPDPETHRAWRDMVLADQMTRAPDTLILPHPRLHQRAFVLIPLAEVAPDWMHPILGQTIQQMADALPEDEKTAVTPL